MKCPTVDNIIESNRRLIMLKKITKAEKHELIRPRESLEIALKRACSGKDVYNNAAILLEELNRGHFFGSANKRTSFVATIDYLKSNNKEILKKPKDDESKFLLKVRKGNTSRKEIKEWLRP